MASSNVLIEKLKGRENFDVWKIAAESYLVIKGLWSHVENDLSEDANDVTKANDLKARSEIILLLETQNYSYIANAKTAKQAWTALTRAFEDSGLYRRVTLLKELVQLKLSDCDSMESYVNRMVMISIKVKKAGLEISDEVIASLMLAGLPDDYKPLVMAVENSTTKLTTDSVKTLLLQEVKYDSSNSDSAMLTKWNINRSNKKKTNFKFKCHSCGQTGHFARDCPKKKEKNKKNENLLYTTFLVNNTNSCDWFIDSGASAHMTNSKSIVNKTKVPLNKEVVVANKDKLKIDCVGEVNITLLSGTSKTNATLTNVQYVPGLCANLLSVSQMIKNGNHVAFDKENCKIFNAENNLIATATMVNDMYRLDCVLPICENKSEISMNETALSGKIDNIMWHRRLGHICDDNLKKVCGAVIGVNWSVGSNNKCIVCIEGKQTRASFKDVGNRAEHLLDLVHSDVCGPLQERSVGGAKYFVTFVDDYSRKVFVFPLREKNQVFNTFLEFKALVENHCSRTIKVLRTDNGTEYCNGQFDDFLAKSGIVHQKTAPYTPEQNGVAERINRTLMERVRCMLIDSGLSKKFWAEALSTAAYLINRIPCRNMRSTTPEEFWSKTKPDLTMLRVFGCKAMVHVPKEKRRKLDKKSTECIMLGYSNESKAYRLYNMATKKVVISRDVLFIESSFPEKPNLKVIEHVDTSTNSSFSPVILTSDECEVDANVNSGGVRDAESSIVDKRRIYKTSDEQIETSGEANVIENVNETEVNDLTIENNAVNLPVTHETFDSNVTTDSDRDELYIPDEVVETPQQVRSSERIRNMDIMRYNFLTKEIIGNDPETVAEALSSPNADLWRKAMCEEMKSLSDNQTWTLVDLPRDKTPIKCKWVFKTKSNADGEVVRYKARLVVKGFSQKHGVDYHETFSPVVKYTSIRFLMAIAAKFDLNIRQMDAVAAFLNGELKEDIYMCQPEEFMNNSNKVCKLHKSLYGLKQSSRVWNEKLNSVLVKFGLKRSNADQCIYYMVNCSRMLFLAIYVDDVLIFSNDETSERLLKDELCRHFEMKDLGDASSALGVRITRDRVAGTISIDQSQYISEILNRFGMSDCNPISTPLDLNQKISSSMCPKSSDEQQEMSNVPYMQAIGSLLFVAQITRPDICYAVNLLSRYSKNPGKAHWVAIKRVLRYLKATIDKKLVYQKPSNEIRGYCDADWASDLDERKSTTGYVFTMQGAAVSWGSKRQPTVALSTTEAEFMAMVCTIQESIWLKRLQLELMPSSSKQMVLYCDNKSAIQLAINNSSSARTKHIEIKSEFIREKVEKGLINIQYKPTDEMLADILTKAIVSNKQMIISKQFGLI